MSEERSKFLQEALFNGNGVAKRLILALVLFSSAVTAVITAIELHADYRRDLRQIDLGLAFVGSSYLPTLTDSVWVADNEQVQLQLEGLLRLPDIEAIAIQVDGRTRWSAGKSASTRKRVEDFALVREHRGRPLTIGTLQVTVGLDAVLARLWGRLLETLLANALKTLLVAGFMLLVFQYLVTQHLTRIAAFTRRIDPEAPSGEELRLERPAGGRWRPDMLDALTASINTLSRSLQDSSVNLRQSDRRLRTLTRETSAYIYELDSDGRILFANRSHSGLGIEQIVGSLLTDWFPLALQHRIAQAVARTFSLATPQRLEYSIPDPAGEPRAYVATIRPILRDGKVSSAALTAVEISEQKAAEQAIRELNASLEARVRVRTEQLQQAMQKAENASHAKSVFLSRMSHELRTPMNAVLGFAQLIEISDPTPRQQKWAFEIRRAGEHLLRMIEDLLDLARIEVGQMAIRVEALELPTLISEAVALVQPMIDARGLQLTVHTSCQQGGLVRADRLRLRQVLVNLLSNAAKYNRPHGTITLKRETHGPLTRLSVTDSGRGIEADKLTSLFQPFERLGAEFGEVEGTGVGLALSKQLAELMGATLGASSSAGLGSEFWIDLAGADGLEAMTPSPTGTPPASSMQDFDLLYVEDNASNVEVIAAFLEAHHPVHLRTAPNGESALALARERPPDIVLMDIHLPGMDGYEILQRMRADPQLAAVPVVALSADAMPHDIQRGLAAGFDRYLSKPVDLKTLLEVLTALLAKPAPPPAPADQGLM